MVDKAQAAKHAEERRFRDEQAPEVGEGEVLEWPYLAQRANHAARGDEADPHRCSVREACRDPPRFRARQGPQPEQQRHQAAQPRPRGSDVDPLDGDVEDHCTAGGGMALRHVSEHRGGRGDPSDDETRARRSTLEEPEDGGHGDEQRHESDQHGRADRGPNRVSEPDARVDHLDTDDHDAAHQGGDPAPGNEGKRGRRRHREDDQRHERRAQQHDQAAIQQPSPHHGHRRDGRRTARLGRFTTLTRRRGSDPKRERAPRQVSIDRGDGRPRHGVDPRLERLETHPQLGGRASDAGRGAGGHRGAGRAQDLDGRELGIRCLGEREHHLGRRG